MTVHFIGAGPGAADLLTLRGRDIIAACPVCLYAGSLVPKEVLSPLINIYAQIGTIFCSSLIIIFFNQWTAFNSVEDLLLILIMGLVGGTGTLFIIYGARKAELSKITPFDYIEIFFALILGWVFFQEWPIDSLFPGVFFIIAGGLIIIWRQKKRNFLKERKA